MGELQFKLEGEVFPDRETEKWFCVAKGEDGSPPGCIQRKRERESGFQTSRDGRNLGKRKARTWTLRTSRLLGEGDWDPGVQRGCYHHLRAEVLCAFAEREDLRF